MQIINLTGYEDDRTIRVNPNHIVAYWYVDEKCGSEVVWSTSGKNSTVKVKETADEIDRLLEAV